MRSVNAKVVRTPKSIDEVEGAFVALEPFVSFIPTAIGPNFQFDD